MPLRFIPRQQVQRPAPRPHPLAAPVNNFMNSLIYMMHLNEKNKLERDKLEFDQKGADLNREIQAKEEGRAAAQEARDVDLYQRQWVGQEKVPYQAAVPPVPAQPGVPYEAMAPVGGPESRFMDALDKRRTSAMGSRLPGMGVQGTRIPQNQTLSEILRFMEQRPRTPATPGSPGIPEVPFQAAVPGTKVQESRAKIAKDEALAKAARARAWRSRNQPFTQPDVEEPVDPFADPFSEDVIERFQKLQTSSSVKPGQLGFNEPQLFQAAERTGRPISQAFTREDKDVWGPFDKNVAVPGQIIIGDQVERPRRKILGRGQAAPQPSAIQPQEALPERAVQRLREAGGQPITFQNGQTWQMVNGQPKRIR